MNKSLHQSILIGGTFSFLLVQVIAVFAVAAILIALLFSSAGKPIPAQEFNLSPLNSNIGEVSKLVASAQRPLTHPNFKLLAAKPSTKPTPAPGIETEVALDPSPTPTVAQASETLPEVIPAPSNDCVVPPGWVKYTIRPLDNLISLAVKFGVTLEQLTQANCMGENTDLFYGKKLYAPYPTLPMPDVKSDEHWIDVDLSIQRLYAFEGLKIVDTFVVSTGTIYYPTVTGQFRVQTKLEKTDMSGRDYNVKDVPSVMYFYQGYAIHGVYWHDYFGIRASHGCVNMRVNEARWLFDWAPLNTIVNIHN